MAPQHQNDLKLKSDFESCLFAFLLYKKIIRGEMVVRGFLFFKAENKLLDGYGVL